MKMLKEYARNIKITKFHISQSAIAGVYILLIFWLMHSLHSELAIASLGASAFIAFSCPHRYSSKPKFFIGGYCIGVISGVICHSLNALLDKYIAFPWYILSCALAIFLSMFLMTILNYEHPSSAALAIAITIDSHPVILGIASVVCILVLCITKELLKKYISDL